MKVRRHRGRWVSSERPSGVNHETSAFSSTGAIVHDNLLEHDREGWRVDLLAPPNGDGTGGLVVVSARHDALWVGYDRAVVQEHIDPVLGRQQRTDVSIERSTAGACA